MTILRPDRGAILRNPKAPTDAVLKLSSSAQKTARFSNVIKQYDKLDGALGKIGTANKFAELAEPVVKQHVPMNESPVA